MNSNFNTRIGVGGDTAGKKDLVAQEWHGINDTKPLNPLILIVAKAAQKLLGGPTRVANTTNTTKQEILGI